MFFRYKTLLWVLKRPFKIYRKNQMGSKA